MIKTKSGNITLEDLNRAYGENGKTFSTMEQAEQYALGRRYARIYRIFDEVDGKRSVIAFLVSIETPPDVKPLPRFTGVVRPSNA